jgi:NAD(P)-dependent dehydrogenase (short-subunit alcohol dehydrogenase family)
LPEATPAPAAIAQPFRLDGSVAIVTGASSGLGVTIAQGLAQAGADVALAGRNVAGLEATRRLVEAAGRRALVVSTEITDPDACGALVQRTLEAFGRLDILVNVAGVGTAVPALRETPDEFRQVIDVNLHGTYWMCQAAARVMKEPASIVNVASVIALTTAGLPQAAYSASKAAVLGLTRDLAQQWGRRRGIRVNAVIPGFFASDLTDQLPEGYIERQADRALLGRIGQHHELAAAVVFLCGPGAGYITGTGLAVDGGFLIGGS